jgi:hypothetical protein
LRATEAQTPQKESRHGGSPRPATPSVPDQFGHGARATPRAVIFPWSKGTPSAASHAGNALALLWQIYSRCGLLQIRIRSLSRRAKRMHQPIPEAEKVAWTRCPQLLQLYAVPTNSDVPISCRRPLAAHAATSKSKGSADMGAMTQLVDDRLSKTDHSPSLAE